MKQTEKFLSAVQTAGENGVTTADLQKLLGGKLQSVHTAAYTLKKKGYKLVNFRGSYVLKDSKNLPAVSQTQLYSPTVSLHSVSDAVLNSMDIPSRLDLIEQMRRVKLHTDIALAIVNSHKYANSLKEKV